MVTKTLLALLLSFTIVINNSVQSLSPPNNATIEFIRTGCGSTLYPSLCFSSLAKYAHVLDVDRDPVRLAHLATNVSRAKVRSVALHVTALSRAPPGPTTLPRVSGELRDCCDTLSTAVEQTYASARELGSIERHEAGPATAWRVFNVQTWMSAAMTNEQTCSDGMSDAESGRRVRDDVCGRVARAMEHTSIALALVNCLVSK